MICVMVYHYYYPEDRDYSKTLQLYKDEKSALKAREDSVEEFRETAIEIIEKYKKDESVDRKWSSFDVENIIESEGDDYQEMIRQLSFECYKCFQIYPLEMQIDTEKDLMCSVELEIFY